MHIRILPAVIALTILNLCAFPGRVSAEEPTSTPVVAATPGKARFFNVRVQTTALSNPAGPLQVVQGRVVAKNGAGIDGVFVRASSSDWQAFDFTKDGGRFKFSLTRGYYTIQLVELVAQEAKLTADGKTNFWVEFQEVDNLPATPTSSPKSPTSTPTPTASPTITATPNPTFTVLPPATVIAGVAPAKPTPTPAQSAFPLPLPPDIDIDPAPWLKVFLYGAGLGGAFVFVGFAVSLMRRL